jgi:hypothetical protein
VDDGLIELHRITALGHGGNNMEMSIEEPNLRDYGFIKFTPLSIGYLANVPALELRDVPGVEPGVLPIWPSIPALPRRASNPCALVGLWLG